MLQLGTDENAGFRHALLQHSKLIGCGRGHLDQN